MDSLGQFLPHTDGQAECGVWGEPDSPRCFWLLCRDTRHLRKLLLLPGPSLEEHAWQRPVRLSLTWRLQPASGPTGSPVWGLLGACPRASALPPLWALCHSTCQSVRKAPCTATLRRPHPPSASRRCPAGIRWSGTQAGTKEHGLRPRSGHLLSCGSRPGDIQCHAQASPVVLTVTAGRHSAVSVRRHEQRGLFPTSPGNSRAGVGHSEEVTAMTRVSSGLGFCSHWG